MNVQIICIGKLKEQYWVDAIKEYQKRLQRFCKFNIIELKEATPTEDERIKREEGQAILKEIKDSTYVVTLEIKGEALSSEEFASKIEKWQVDGISDIAFVIGGSLGLSPEVSKRANYKLSFSKMTFPHQLMRVILLEQIYRAFKINANETYHK